MRVLVTLALSLTLTVSVAAQTTHFVDPAGGAGIHTDIQSAIAAAAHGDIIDVAPGVYAPFTCSKGVTIIGTVGADVMPDSTLQNLPSGRQIMLADLHVRGIEVLSCDGVVAFNGVTFGGPGLPQSPLPQSVLINDSEDVRMHGCSVVGGPTGIHTSSARLEFVQTTVTAGGGSSSDCGAAGSGANAMYCASGRVHIARSNFTGGDGGIQTATCQSFCGAPAGDGGAGVRLDAGELLVVGNSPGALTGGRGACGEWEPCDGYGGPGLLQWGGDAVFYAGSLLGGVPICSGGGDGADHAMLGGTWSTPVPEWASLEIAGSQTGGGTVTFTAHGPPGANLRVWLGRFAEVVPSPNPTIPVERLCQWLRAAAPGNLPASGQRSVDQPLPHWLPRGFTFWVQAELVANGGEVLRTNSLSVVVR